MPVSWVSRLLRSSDRCYIMEIVLTAAPDAAARSVRSAACRSDVAAATHGCPGHHRSSSHSRTRHKFSGCSSKSGSCSTHSSMRSSSSSGSGSDTPLQAHQRAQCVPKISHAAAQQQAPPQAVAGVPDTASPPTLSGQGMFLAFEQHQRTRRFVHPVIASELLHVLGCEFWPCLPLARQGWKQPATLRSSRRQCPGRRSAFDCCSGRRIASAHGTCSDTEAVHVGAALLSSQTVLQRRRRLSCGSSYGCC